jgi:hypothetical protein
MRMNDIISLPLKRGLSVRLGKERVEVPQGFPSHLQKQYGVTHIEHQEQMLDTASLMFMRDEKPVLQLNEYTAPILQEAMEVDPENLPRLLTQGHWGNALAGDVMRWRLEEGV